MCCRRKLENPQRRYIAVVAGSSTCHVDFGKILTIKRNLSILLMCYLLQYSLSSKNELPTEQ